MKKILNNSKHLHFVGIGGIGMSGMAELLYNHGFKISGSDISSSCRTRHLNKYKNIKIHRDHRKENIKNCEVLIYSSAVKMDNPEIIAAKDLDIPIMKRSQLLGELIKVKDISVGVAGTHGKTTCSSMLGCILYEAKKNPTLIIGGIVNKFGTNNISGSGDMIVVEADEFDKSFLSLNPTYSILNNLDLEHLDCYENLDDLLNTFIIFANLTPFYGKLAYNKDSENLQLIEKKIRKPKISFGIKNSADIMATNIQFKKELSIFNIIIKNTNENINIEIPCPGIHNVYNALAAITIALELEISNNHIINALKTYSGVKRRFEIKYQNTENGIMIIDDYAHHPKEIEETISAAKNGWNKRIISIFQPHLFSRTKDFHKEFANALNNSDINIITSIYPAREKPIKGITSRLIVEYIKDSENTYFIPKKEEIARKVKSILNKNDIIITMGAGNINSVINDIIKIIC